MNITDIGFNGDDLKRLVKHHCGDATRQPPSAKPVSALVLVENQKDTPPALLTPRQRRSPDPTAIPPGAITAIVNQTIAATGLERTTIDAPMKNGTLERVKVGSRTLITVASIHALLERADGIRPRCGSPRRTRGRPATDRARRA